MEQIEIKTIDDFIQDLIVLKSKLFLLPWYSFVKRKSYKKQIIGIDKTIWTLKKIKMNELKNDIFIKADPFVKLLIIGLEILLNTKRLK